MAMNEDPIQGTPQNDYLQGTSGDDTIYGLGGNDEIYGRGGNDILVGGAGTDYLEGGAGNDVYRFERGFGLDYLYNYDNHGDGQDFDAVEFGAGIAPSEIVLERAGNQLGIRIVGTDDVIWVQNFFASGSGYDYTIDEIRFADGTVWDTAEIRARQLVGTDADQVLGGTEGDDTIDGAGGSDDISGYGGNDTLSGGSGNDGINGGDGDDTVDGGIGSDTLYGEDGNDTVLGGSGEDRLYGGTGDDILIGGTGADYMEGGVGNDIYRLAAGFGHDQISNWDDYYNGQENDIVEFEAGISPSQVEVLKQSNDLLIRINGGADTLTIKGFFDQGSANYDRKIDGVRFADGTVWDTDELIRKHLVANDTDQEMSGTNGDDIIDGGGGNDNISGNDGNDTLLGGSGDDQLYGGQGNDTIAGGSGGSYIDGGDGDDTLTGGDTYDTLYGDSGNDILVGGGGSYDSLSGGSGSDTYRFARGDGYDQINDSHDQASLDHDVLEFGPGIDTSEILLLRDGNSLLLRIFGSDDTVYVGYYFQSSWDYGVDEIRFDDGTQWTRNDVIGRALVPVSGSNAGETLEGDASNDFLDGGYGDDELHALAGNDLLVGGLGNDRMDGGAGDDTYLLQPGAGSDVIDNFDDHSDGLDFDTVKFDTGVAAEDITVAGTDHDLVLTNSVTGDTLTIAGFFDEGPAGNSDRQIDQVKFHNGTTWSAEDLILKQMVGTDADQVMHGRAVGDTLDASAGNDIVYGHDGDDVLVGGLGDDSLIGGKGSDTYSFESGWGRDVIENAVVNAGSQDADAIEFGVGILPTDIAVSSDGLNLVLSSAATGDSITILNFFASDGQAGTGRLQQVRFADTTTWDIAELIARQMVGTDADQYMHGTEGGDSIDAGNGNDQVSGHAGADNLLGGDGDDVLDGGAGNDVMDGGAGNDIFIYKRGSGHDQIVSDDIDGIYFDTIQFGEDITADQLAVEKHGRDLVFKLQGTDDSLTVKNFYPASPDGWPDALDEVWFADGTIWDVTYVLSVAVEIATQIVGTEGDDFLMGTVQDDEILGLGGNDTIYGSSGNDVLIGGTGNDIMVGGGDGDIYRLEAGWGQDAIENTDWNNDGASVAAVEFGAGISSEDIEIVVDGNDLLLVHAITGDSVRIKNYGTSTDFAGGFDTRIDEVRFSDGIVWTSADLDARLNGTEADQILHGFDVDDTIDALGGNDVVYGHGGNDTLGGGAGDDILVGGAGDDALDGGAGNDTYRFEIGSGSDTITNSDSSSQGLDFDVIEFGAGISAEDIEISAEGYSLILTNTLTGDVVRVSVYGISPYYLGDDMRIDEVRFADGTVWTQTYLTQLLMTATEGGETLLGTAAGDTIDGLGGNDSIYGSGGDDILIGGAGNDLLEGYQGNDTYRFELGWGADRINNNGATGDLDVIEFGSGISPDDIAVTAEGGESLWLRHVVTGDSIRVMGALWFDFMRIGEIRFSDGTVWTTADLEGMLWANSGADQALQGTADADIIDGGEGHDTLIGFAGDDTLDGGVGSDQIYGGVGDDTLSGGAGDDALYGGAGHDALYGGDGNDTFHFALGSGTDIVQSQDAGSLYTDVIKFGSGIAAADVQVQRSGDDLVLIIAGTPDSKTVKDFFAQAGGGAPSAIDEVRFDDGTVWDVAYIMGLFPSGEHITGTTGDDALQGTAGNDTIEALGGNDQVSGGAGDDLLIGGEGDDTLLGNDGGTYVGNDTLFGGNGNDTLYVGYGDDVLSGDGGNDDLIDDGGSDIFLFEAGWGQDAIFNMIGGLEGFDVVKFGSGIEADDIAVSTNGYDVFLTHRTSGDSIRLDAYAQVYENGSPNDDGRIDEIQFADGTVWDKTELAAWLSTGTAAGEGLMGTDGNDTINAGADDDRVFGYWGDDVLNGEAGADELTGGHGADTLYGGSGNDLLIGDKGDDTYRFELGDGQDIVERAWNEFDTSVMGYDRLVFGAGIAADDIAVHMEENTLVLANIATGDIVRVNDFVFYAESDMVDDYTIDEIRFADGTVWDVPHILSLLSDPEVVNGTAGDDQVFGTEGADVIDGLGGNDAMYGLGGNDVLIGGAGYDWMDAGVGDDVYRFSPGFGNDRIMNNDGYADGNDIDTIEFGAGISPDDIAITTNGFDLYLAVAATQDVLEIGNYLQDTGEQAYDYLVEQVKFADGTVWGAADLVSRLLAGTEANQYLSGTSSDDVINAGGGNDSVYGRRGNDVLNGGTGLDLLDGGPGNDTYKFDLGSGSDFIYNQDLASDGFDYDSIEFGAGVGPADVIVEKLDDYLSLRISGTTDQLLIQNYFVEYANGNTFKIDEIRFADDTVWDQSDVIALLPAGDRDSQTIYGTEDDDEIVAGSGHNRVYAAGGNDTLTGSAGNDFLKGGAGDDVYRFGLGDGQDTIDNVHFPAVSQDNDVIEFGAGIAPEDLVFTKMGEWLTISLTGTNDSITHMYFVEYVDGSVNHKISGIKFADGTVWDQEDIALALPEDVRHSRNYYGSNGNDTIYAGAGRDVLFGMGGNDVLAGEDGFDTIDGGAGDDILIGGQGDDVLAGGAGNNIYRMESGFGEDRLSSSDDYSDGQNLDVIEFGPGIVASDVVASQYGSNLTLSVSGTSDSVLIAGHFDASQPQYDSAVDEVRFHDGTVWTSADLAAKVLLGTSADQSIYGTSANNTIDAAGGNDTVYGSDGADVLNGGTGNDVLNGEAGNDTLDGGSGNDIYRFELGSGQDTVNNYDDAADGFDADEIQLGSGILASNTFLEIYGDDLFVRIGGTADSLLVHGHFLPPATEGHNFSIEGIRFADGTFWDKTYIDTHATFPDSLTTGGGLESLAIANQSMDEGRELRMDERTFARNRMTQSLPAELGGRGQPSVAVDFNEIHRLVDTMSAFGGGEALLPDSGRLYEIRWPMASGQMF